MRAHYIALLAIALALGGVRVAAQTAQSDPPLVGPARDIARDLIVIRAVFDPLTGTPFTSDPQAVIDVHGSDISAIGHAALRNGDDSYGISASAPLSSGKVPWSIVDPYGMRPHANIGFDFTNIIWRPKARPALEKLLQPEGFARVSPDTRAAVAHVIEQGDAVDVPFVLFVHAGYGFNQVEYQYLDAKTRASRTELLLNDNASLTGGVQFLVRGTDPGYFVDVGYIYSSVFHDQPAVDGAVVGGPFVYRTNSIRLEARRLMPNRRVGFNGSFLHDYTFDHTTVDVTAYTVFTPSAAHDVLRMTAGLKVGHRSGTESGTFVTVFAGPVFGARR